MSQLLPVLYQPILKVRSECHHRCLGDQVRGVRGPSFPTNVHSDYMQTFKTNEEGMEETLSAMGDGFAPL